MAKPFRIYMCSDIHASERAWRKFVNAMRTNVYKVDAALIAGDLTGKALVAVVRGEGGGDVWTADLLGQRRVARDEAELAELERSIADVGYYAVRVTEAERAAMEADPALVKTAFQDQITPAHRRVDGPRRRAPRGLRRARLPDAGQRRRIRDRPAAGHLDLLPERQRAGRRPQPVAPAGEHGLVIADAVVDPARAAGGGVPGQPLRPHDGGARPAADGDDDPRPALRLGARHGAPALRPTCARRCPPAICCADRSGSTGVRKAIENLQARARACTATSTSRAANGGSAKPSA